MGGAIPLFTHVAIERDVHYQNDPSTTHHRKKPGGTSQFWSCWVFPVRSLILAPLSIFHLFYKRSKSDDKPTPKACRLNEMDSSIPRFSVGCMLKFGLSKGLTDLEG